MKLTLELPRLAVGHIWVRFPMPVREDTDTGTDTDTDGEEGGDEGAVLLARAAKGRTRQRQEGSGGLASGGGSGRGDGERPREEMEMRRPRAFGAAFRGGRVEAAVLTSGKLMEDVWKVPVRWEGGVSHSLEITWAD